MNKKGLFLVQANRLSREGLMRLFAGSAFAVQGEAADAQEAIELMSRSPGAPDIILIDPAGTTGAEIGALRIFAPTSKVVVLTAGADGPRLQSALDAGAHGYLLMDIAPEALMQSLTLVMLGEKVFPANLAVIMLAGRRSPAPGEANARAGLSAREGEILRHLMRGTSNKQIAAALDISEATVKVHLKSLLRKTGSSNRTQAAMWGLNHGVAAGEKVLEKGWWADGPA